MAAEQFLDTILAWKRKEVAQHRAARPLDAVRQGIAGVAAPRSLAAALRRPGLSLIAEIKRASPSKGVLRGGLDAAALAGEYEANGAAAISVLTDRRFFQGDLDDLRAVRRQVAVPVLRKDFIVDPYQVYEARAAGADAILLIVAALADRDLCALHELARELGLSVLVEVHDAAEIERALNLAGGPEIVGINNRNLRTFDVDLETTARLRPLLPAGTVVVAESGIDTPADVARLAALGIDAMLIGESLVRAPDAGAKIRELMTNDK